MILNAGTQTRTADLRITNALLYQLSYSGTEEGEAPEYIRRSELLAISPPGRCA